ncbi:hypothetical protein EDC04DRAFT_2608350 [Pisolithus marmoratus]|nr:hypothetical protein EDC04DRAFT_2608350 [Pisolithus marmoratus]
MFPMVDNNHTSDNLWKEFTEWLDMLDETSQQFVPPMVLSAASVFWEIEMFHPIEPRPLWFPLLDFMCIALVFCESDNYAKHAAILRWTAAFECSPYCKLDMYHTIHALHACSPPSGPHCLLSSMFQVHLTVDVSLGILMVLARAGMDALHGICSCDNAADDSCGTTVDSLSMEARRGPRIYEPQGFSGVGSSWGDIEDDGGGTATFECSWTDPYPDAEKVIVHLYVWWSFSIQAVEEVTAILLECSHWQQHVNSVGSADPSPSIIHCHINFHVLVMPRPLDPTDTPLSNWFVQGGHTVGVAKPLLGDLREEEVGEVLGDEGKVLWVEGGVSRVEGVFSRVEEVATCLPHPNYPVLLGACDCVERDMEACCKFIDPTVNDTLESPLAPQQMDAPKHGCEESLSIAGSARRPTVLNYLRRSLADKREGHVPRHDSNAEPVYSSIELQVLENGTTKTEAECLCYH